MVSADACDYCFETNLFEAAFGIIRDAHEPSQIEINLSGEFDLLCFESQFFGNHLRLLILAAYQRGEKVMHGIRPGVRTTAVLGFINFESPIGI